MAASDAAVLDRPTKQRVPAVVISKAMRHQVILIPADDFYDARGSLRPTNKGKTAVFHNYRYTVRDEDELDLILQHPAYTGVGEEKSLWLEDEVGMPDPALQVQVIQGVQTVGPRPQNPPVNGWDDFSPDRIAELLVAGRVDPYRALDWERGHKNRGIVKQTIARVIADAPAESAQEVPDSFGAGGEV